MCSIFGSFDIDTLRELANLNSYRGTHSHSIATFNENGLYSLRRGFGPVQLDDLSIRDNEYIICHQQAPTTEARSSYSVHPAEYKHVLLWHNGILKEETIKKLQTLLSVDEKWDTMLLLKYINTNGFDLSIIDGSFSCVYAKDSSGIFLFRNEISPLFIDNKMNISSHKFINSTATPAYTILKFDPFTNTLLSEGVFENNANPYYFGE